MNSLPPTSDLPSDLRDSILGLAIGSASWIIRYACSTEKHSLGYIARRTVIAGFTSLLVGVATKSYFQHEGIAFAAAGAAGYASPELVEALITWVKNRGKSKG